VHDTWAVRDLPVLDATIALLEQSFMVTVTDIAALTGFDPDSVAKALEALDPVYVDFRKTTTGGDPRFWYVFKVTPEARRAVGQWPSAEALADRLAAELTSVAQGEPDAERQGLLVYAARLIGETLREETVRAAREVLAPAFGGAPVPEVGSPVPEPELPFDDDYPSLVDLPELPELLRQSARGSRPDAVAPAPSNGQELEPLPEPGEANAEDAGGSPPRASAGEPEAADQTEGGNRWSALG
jgi:hypothetical protein